MLQSTFDLLRRRWADLGLIGVANLLAQLLTYLVIVGVATPVFFGLFYGSAGRRMAIPRMTMTTGFGFREIFGLAGGAAGIASLLVCVVTFAATAFMLAGLFGSVARLRKGEPVGFRSYWNAGAAGFGRAFWVSVGYFVGALIVLVVVGGLLWFLLPFNLIVWGLLAIPATLYFLLYPVYLTTVEGLGVGEAFRTAWKALVGDPGEAALAGVTVLALSVVYSVLLGLLFRLGFIGQLLGGLVQLLAMPTFILYVIERYEARVRGRAAVR